MHVINFYVLLLWHLCDSSGVLLVSSCAIFVGIVAIHREFLKNLSVLFKNRRILLAFKYDFMWKLVTFVGFVS